MPVVVEESIEVEDVGKRLSLTELIEDLEKTEDRLRRHRTADGIAGSAPPADDEDNDRDEDQKEGTNDDDEQQEQQKNVDLTQDTCAPPCSSSMKDDDDQSGHDDINESDASGVSNDDGKDQKPSDDNDAGDTKMASMIVQDRRRKHIVLAIAVLAFIGLAVGLALFIKGIVGIKSDNKTSAAASASASSSSSSSSDAAVSGTTETSNVDNNASPTSMPTAAVQSLLETSFPTASPAGIGPVETADETSIYEQFGVGSPQEGGGEAEEVETTTIAPTVVPTTTPTTLRPTLAPVSVGPTSAPSTNAPITNSPVSSGTTQTVVSAEGPASFSPTTSPVSARPTSSPEQQTTTATTSSTGETTPPPKPIETAFDLHIKTQDFTTNFYENRANFGQTVSGATMDLYRRVLDNVARPQSLQVRYNWDGCNPYADDGCVPDTVIIASFQGTAFQERGSNTRSEGDAADTVRSAFVNVFSDPVVLGNWINAANAKDIMVTSVAVYRSEEEIGFFSVSNTDIEGNADVVEEEVIDNTLDDENMVATPPESMETDELPLVDTTQDATNVAQTVCEIEPIYIHIWALPDSSFLDYDLRQMVVDSTYPYLSDALTLSMGSAFWGLSLRVPQNNVRQLEDTFDNRESYLRARRAQRRSLNHISGDEYDVQLITKATVVGGETVCDEVRRSLYSSLSGDMLDVWIERVNVVGLPVASAEVKFGWLL